MSRSSADGVFTRKVTAVFSTKAVAFALSLATSVALSRILGPEGKGEYVAVIYVPGLLSAIGVFGMPSAINYFSARGASIMGLLRMGLLMAAGLAAVLVGAVVLTLPWLEQSIFSAAPPQWLWLGIITVPAALFGTFANGILYGRQRTRTYSWIVVGQAFATLCLALLFVAVLNMGVVGAVLASVSITWLFAIRVIVAVVMLARREPGGSPVPYRSLVAYGLKIMPASITGYFNYRIDVFILQALLVGQAAELGLYNMAFTMAELLFYIPDSVTTIFLPRVSGATAAEANASLPRVARFTVLLTVVCGLALIPVAFVGVHVVLPQFEGCLPAFFVLLPGIMAMALAKVASSYVSGRGRPGIVSIGASIALVINVVANLVLIPRFGIVGASTASLFSYGSLAAFMLMTASRVSHLSPLTILMPGKEEMLLLRRTLGRLGSAVVARVTKAGRRGVAESVATTEGPRS
ncbi:MAG: polysaccharide biosynthesis C-terminal domain-containing protein [Candidatus Limnocylindrales bacterium]|jgi:O-antigen/teichoic acid export membrane protein